MKLIASVALAFGITAFFCGFAWIAVLRNSWPALSRRTKMLWWLLAVVNVLLLVIAFYYGPNSPLSDW